MDQADQSGVVASLCHRSPKDGGPLNTRNTQTRISGVCVAFFLPRPSRRYHHAACPVRGTNPPPPALPPSGGEGARRASEGDRCTKSACIPVVLSRCAPSFVCLA